MSDNYKTNVKFVYMQLVKTFSAYFPFLASVWKICMTLQADVSQHSRIHFSRNISPWYESPGVIVHHALHRCLQGLLESKPFLHLQGLPETNPNE
jgi:hypothetical protein